MRCARCSPARARTCALLAPSFPAAFLDTPPDRLVGALHAAGFAGVFEVAFGADLVSYEYYRRFRAIVERAPDDFLISSPCPAVVQYVEKMLPELTPHLAPVVSPMEATARVVRSRFDPQGQARLHRTLRGEEGGGVAIGVVDAVLTFAELVELFRLGRRGAARAAPGRLSPAPREPRTGSTL